MFDSGPTGSGTWLPTALTAFGGFATAALSYLSLRALDARKDERTYQREKSARDEARRDAIIERRNSIQRKTLFELQDAVFNFVQACSFNATRDRSSAKWEATKDEISEAMRKGYALTAKLSVRVRDDEIRERLKELKKHLISVESIADDKARMSAFLEVDPINKSLHERIRVVLKKMDDIELAE